MSVHWSRGLYDLIKQQGIRQVSLVPDAGHSALIRLCEADPELRMVRLTTEEEGIALAVGAVACWRRGWDSNPRYGYPYNGFRDRDPKLRSARAAKSILGGCRPPQPF
jgi:hypothetical protein